MGSCAFAFGRGWRDDLQLRSAVHLMDGRDGGPFGCEESSPAKAMHIGCCESDRLGCAVCFMKRMLVVWGRQSSIVSPVACAWKGKCCEVSMAMNHDRLLVSMALARYFEERYGNNVFSNHFSSLIISAAIA
jgi:hypothetical protein